MEKFRKFGLYFTYIWWGVGVLTLILFGLTILTHEKIGFFVFGGITGYILWAGMLTFPLVAVWQIIVFIASMAGLISAVKYKCREDVINEKKKEFLRSIVCFIISLPVCFILYYVMSCLFMWPA